MHGTLCHKLECWSNRRSSFRMDWILSYVKCMWFTGNFSLTLSIFYIFLALCEMKTITALCIYDKALILSCQKSDFKVVLCHVIKGIEPSCWCIIEFIIKLVSKKGYVSRQTSHFISFSIACLVDSTIYKHSCKIHYIKYPVWVYQNIWAATWDFQQVSLRRCAVWSEPLQVAWILYEC